MAGEKTDLQVVCWRYPDGRVGRGSPLSADGAQAMLQTYKERYPDRIFWIEAAR